MELTAHFQRAPRLSASEWRYSSTGQRSISGGDCDTCDDNAYTGISAVVMKVLVIVPHRDLIKAIILTVE